MKKFYNHGSWSINSPTRINKESFDSPSRVSIWAFDNDFLFV